MNRSESATPKPQARDGAVVFRPAEPQDDPILRALLREAALPFEDIASNRQDFVVAVVDGEVAGCVGLEMFDRVGLLRSLIVREPRRGGGLGRTLVERILAVAKGKGAQRLFLLTTTASSFFARRGFEPVHRDRVPEAMAKSSQFASLCPSTAACMMIAL